MSAPPATTSGEPLARDVWSISRLNREARTVLEGSFPLLWIQGELSNLSRPASGHLYFTLKDAAAQVRCAMFRPRQRLLRTRPANGDQVLVRARVSLYDARGEFQLIVEHLEPAGDGLWRLELERLKQRLATEGLFDEAAKRPLPAFPRQIGLITSPSGAAVRDLLTVLGQRLRALPLILYPVAVQGDAAAEEIARALALAGRRGECDILILARGGGAYEDLMAFNDERVVRAIRAAPMPVVTGVGHEIDITLADLAADRRAATPSAAAELVSPCGEHLAQRLRALRQRLQTAVRRPLGTSKHRLLAIARHLRLMHPATRLQQQAQGLDGFERRIRAAMQRRIDGHKRGLHDALVRLGTRSPRPRLAPLGERTRWLEHRLARSLAQGLDARHNRLAELARGLDALSPLATLQRGYALLTREPDGAIVRRTDDAPPGTRLIARLAEGRLTCRVEAVADDDGGPAKVAN